MAIKTDAWTEDVGGVSRDTTGESTNVGTSLGRECTTSSGISLQEGISSTDVHYVQEMSAQSFLSAVSEDGARFTAPVKAPPLATKPITVDPRTTDLNHFHDVATFHQLCDVGHFGKVRGLSDCCRGDGKVELYTWDKMEPYPPGGSVVVKRVKTGRTVVNRGKEQNEFVLHMYGGCRDAEDTLSEIGVYCYLAAQKDVPQFILRMYTAFESGPDIWLCLEHAEQGDLFNMVQHIHRSGADQSQVLPRIMLWAWQLLQGVGYLHKHGIGHRDISIENVLLRNNDLRLMDFGQGVRTHSSDNIVLRYFSAVGKPYYRPPESYVPRDTYVKVDVPEGASADDVVFACAETSETMALCEVKLPNPLPSIGQTCDAKPWGYAVAPMDVWACGICIFVMATGMPPWRQAIFQDGHFNWVHTKGDNGIAEMIKVWKKPMPEEALTLLGHMLRGRPTRRPTAEECLGYAWFTAFKSKPVDVQEKAAFDVPELATAKKPGREASEGSTTASSRGDAEDGSHAIATSGMAGDFYTMAAAQRSAAGDASSPFSTVNAEPFGGSSGDCYNESDIYRSTCPATLPLYESQAPPALKCLQRFSCDDLPPALRIDPGFTLEQTTFHSVGSPADIGNHLLDFITGVLGASIKKVNPKKYTIKADVQGETGVCTVKVRMYSEDDSKLAVEFQRRGGDPMRLYEIFEQAEEYLSHLAQALSPADAAGPFGAEAAQQADPFEMTGEVQDLSSLSQWTDPGVRGLLQRRRRPPVPSSSSIPAAEAPSSSAPRPPSKEQFAQQPAAAGSSAAEAASSSSLVPRPPSGSKKAASPKEQLVQATRR